MLQVIGHTLPYDKYDKFVLSRRDDYFMMKWQLIGVFGKKHEHFIANSDNEDEIRIWADIHNITIDKTIENYSHGQFIYADYYKHCSFKLKQKRATNVGRYEQHKDRLRIMKSKNNTAVVEKIWKIDSRNFKFDPDNFNYALVRPCDVTYTAYKNFITCKHPKCKMITHEGAVLAWHRDEKFAFSSEPKTFEEMMVNASFNKQTTPDFENWLFDVNWKTYTVKTIDLRTGKVLYDGVDKWLNETKKRGLI